MKNWLKKIRRRWQQPQQLSSLNAYKKWAQLYPAQAHNTLMEIEQTSMLALMPELSDKIVLDLACGTGRYGLLAQSAGANTVIGFDNSIPMLNNREITDVACSTTNAIPLANSSIDVILCGLALGHLPTIETTFAEISRVLKPDGIALISDFHPYQYLSGARRTFTDGKQTYHVEHYIHHISEYVTVAHTYRLQLTALVEPIYQQNQPVVVVFRFSNA